MPEVLVRLLSVIPAEAGIQGLCTRIPLSPIVSENFSGNKRRRLRTTPAKRCRGDRQFQQVALTRFGGFCQSRQARSTACRVARRAHLRQAPQLRFADRSVIHHSSTSICSSSAGWYLFTPTMISRPASMRACRRAAASSMRILGMPGLDGLGHAAERFDFLDVVPGLVHQLVGQRLHIVAAGPRVDHAA